MRQTNRQNVGPPGRDSMLDDPAQMGYSSPMILADVQYPSKYPAEAPRSHAPQSSSSSSSSHRRTRHHDEPVEPRKWSTAY